MPTPAASAPRVRRHLDRSAVLHIAAYWLHAGRTDLADLHEYLASRGDDEECKYSLASALQVAA